MSDGMEEARRRAEEDHRRDQQAKMKTEQEMRDYVTRNEYNAELARRRQSGS